MEFFFFCGGEGGGGSATRRDRDCGHSQKAAGDLYRVYIY